MTGLAADSVRSAGSDIPSGAELVARAQALEVEWGQLQLEQSTWGMPARGMGAGISACVSSPVHSADCGNWPAIAWFTRRSAI